MVNRLTHLFKAILILITLVPFAQASQRAPLEDQSTVPLHQVLFDIPPIPLDTPQLDSMIIEIPPTTPHLQQFLTPDFNFNAHTILLDQNSGRRIQAHFIREIKIDFFQWVMVLSLVAAVRWFFMPLIL